MSIPRTEGACETPGGLDCALRATHSTATSLSRRPRPARRPAPRAAGPDGVVLHQVGVEVVVPHRPRRRVGDAARDDPHPGAVDPPQLVAGRDRLLDPREAGGGRAHLRELSLHAGGVGRVLVDRGLPGTDGDGGNSATPATTGAASPSPSRTFQPRRFRRANAASCGMSNPCPSSRPCDRGSSPHLSARRALRGLGFRATGLWAAWTHARRGRVPSWKPSPDPTCRGAEFVDANLRGARFVRADLSGVVMRGSTGPGRHRRTVALRRRRLLRVNGVDVIPRRGRARPPLPRPRPPTRRRPGWPPPGLAELERTWAATLERVAAMPVASSTCRSTASIRPDGAAPAGDRHLAGSAILGIEQPFHPIGRRPGAEDDGLDLSIFTTTTPSYAEVLEVRAGRVAMVRDFLATVTAEELAMVRTNPGTPTTGRPRCPAST